MRRNYGKKELSDPYLGATLATSGSELNGMRGLRLIKRRFAVAVLLLAGVATLAGCGSGGDDSAKSSSGDKTIKVGFSGDFSGLLAAYDVPAKNGMEFAVDEINNSDSEYKVDLQTVDNKNDPQLTVSQTQELIDSGHLLNVIGTGDGRNAAATLVGQSGGLALGTLNTYPSFTEEAGPNSALLTVSDNIQAAASAQYACDQGYKTVFTFYSDDFAYSKGLPTYFKEAFAKMCGGKVPGSASFSLGATDFSAQITKLKNFSPQPDAIYSPMFVPDSVTFAKQLRQAGITLPYLSSDANYLQDFVDSAGSAADGVVTSPYAFAGPGTPLKKFQDDYRKATGKATATPLYEAIGRDQIYALVKAAELAGSTEPTAILEKFADVPADTYVAVTDGVFDSDTRRFSTTEIPLVKIEDGKFAVVDNIKPEFVPAAVR